MSKSILVIDTPECCDYCPLGRIFGMDGAVECRARAMKEIAVNRESKTIPDWCPLKEVPEKYDVVSMNFERGYNACIDEILEGCEKVEQ